jgi:hypothetical protein
VYIFSVKRFIPILFLCSTAFAQPLDLKKFESYETQKLDKAVGMAYWLFIPGGGIIYSGSNSPGFLVFGATLFVDLWVLRSKKDDLLMPILALVAIRITDLSITFSRIDSYNADLRASLGIHASTLPANGIQVQLSLSL